MKEQPAPHILGVGCSFFLLSFGGKKHCRLSGENLGGYFYEVSEVQLQLLGKLLDGDDVQFRPVNVFEFPSQSIPCDTDCDWAEPATGSWCQERCVS